MENGIPVRKNEKVKLLQILMEQTKNIMEKNSELRNTFQETFKLGDRLEFINGEVVPQLPKLKHNIPLKNLLNIVRAHIQVTKQGLVKEDALVSLTHNDLMPDISYFSNVKSKTIAADTIFYPAPDFVVEVLGSTSDIVDKVVKLNEYEQNGIKEYWIVSPEDQDVFHYLLNDAGKYHMVERFSESVSSQVLNLKVPLNAIFDGGINLSFIHELTVED